MCLGEPEKISPLIRDRLQCSKDILRSQGSDFSRAGSGQQNGHLPQQQPQGAEYDSFSSSAQYGTGIGQAASEDGARAQFLEEYDAATLQLCNRLSNANATSVAETTTSKVAPWSCVPGYLVSRCAALVGGPDGCLSGPGRNFSLLVTPDEGCGLGAQGHLTPEQDQALQQMRASFPQSTRWHTDHDILRYPQTREHWPFCPISLRLTVLMINPLQVPAGTRV